MSAVSVWTSHPTLDHLLYVTFELSLRCLYISCSYCQTSLLDYSFPKGYECRTHLCISSATKHDDKVRVKHTELNEWMKDAHPFNEYFIDEKQSLGEVKLFNKDPSFYSVSTY